MVYESAFVDTATDRSLDRVVALLGIERAHDVPIGKARFSGGQGGGLVTVQWHLILSAKERAVPHHRRRRCGWRIVSGGQRGRGADHPIVGSQTGWTARRCHW